MTFKHCKRKGPQCKKKLRSQDAGTVSTSQTPTPPGHLNPDQLADLQSQILALKEDIAFMQGEEAKISTGADNSPSMGGFGATRGAYPNKILEEQTELAQLQAQMKAGGGQPY
jgi:hypothetical protein